MSDPTSFLKPHLQDLVRTKHEGKTRKGCLRLDMNEGIPGLPDDLVRTVLCGIDAEYLSTYPEYDGLIAKIAAHNGLEPENICLSNGSDGAIKYIFDAYISAGDKVLLTDPTFAMYPVYCKMFGSENVVVPYKPDFSFPADEFSGKLYGTKAAVVVNPNNPTGSLMARENLLSLVEKASESGVLMIVDEAYFYFCSETVIDTVNTFKNLIVLRTFSKLCGIASARVGYAAACREIVDELKKVKPTFDVNGIGVAISEQIIDKPKLLSAMIKQAMEGKRFLIERLAEARVEYREGNANFVLINCTDRADEVVIKLAEQGILVSGGFKQDFLEGYVRVTVGNKAIMERFWNEFISIWGKCK